MQVDELAEVGVAGNEHELLAHGPAQDIAVAQLGIDQRRPNHVVPRAGQRPSDGGADVDVEQEIQAALARPIATKLSSWTSSAANPAAART